MSTATEDFLAVDAQAPAKVPRDRYGRPGIRPAGGGDLVHYTRASTLGKALDDTEALTQWKLRICSVGLASRKDLILAANAHRSDPTTMNDIVTQAMEAAESRAAATSGTALHDALQAADEGREVWVPDEYLKDIESYQHAMRHLEVDSCEVFVVNDELQVAGTYDRAVRLKTHATAPDGRVLKPGTLLTADIKTGKSVKHGHTSWACQVAVYSRSTPYDIETETRVDAEVPNQDWGIVIHSPVLTGQTQLLWIDLQQGWRNAKLAMEVRAARKVKTMQGCELQPTWADQIAAASSLDVLRNVWIACAEAQEASDEIKAAMVARSKELAA